MASVEYLALCLAPSACFWLALHAGSIVRTVRRRWRTNAPADVPAGPPLERVAADIRRIAALVDALPPQAPWARRYGTILAYDDALGVACRSLDIDDALRNLPFGPSRDATRVRVEAELECAGLVLGPPGPA